MPETSRPPLSRRLQARFFRVVNVPMRLILGLPVATPLGRNLMLAFVIGRKSGTAWTGGGDCWDRVCLTSFSGRRLEATRRLLPRPVCSATAPAGIGAIRAGLPARTLAARFSARSVLCAQIPFGMATSRFIDRAHAAGLQVHAWTVNDAAVMASLLTLGVDGIMTDQTELLRDVLLARGQWRPRISG